MEWRVGDASHHFTKAARFCLAQLLIKTDKIWAQVELRTRGKQSDVMESDGPFVMVGNQLK
jgi:hypothetical protein